jgi:hypothetical protein
MPNPEYPSGWPRTLPNSINLPKLKTAEEGTKLRWNMFWAMAMTNVNGCLERIGVARIPQTALLGSYPPGPVWKESILGWVSRTRNTNWTPLRKRRRSLIYSLYEYVI